jgi:inner membrane protein
VRRRPPASTPAVLEGALAVVVAADAAIALLTPVTAVLAMFDEPAHLATAVVVLLAVARGLPDELLLAALVGSVALDVDHIPHFLGTEAWTAGTPRPYSHALWTPLVLAALGALLGRRRPRARAVAFGLALGTCCHMLRDLGTGDGISLLWPLSDRGFRAPWVVYVAVLLGFAAVAWRRTAER